MPEFEGDGNSDKEKNCGLCLKIEFNDEYQRDYNELIKTKITSIPIEYYKIVRMSFARENITIKKMPIKSVLINSTSISARSSNIYISKIKDDLTVQESAILLQTYRKSIEETFINDSKETLNRKINENSDISKKKLKYLLIYQ